MNLDFTALSGTASTAPSMRKPWGQTGTPGTRAFMRVPGSRGVGDEPGTGGDGGATVPTKGGAAASSSKRCPRVSPVRPPPSEGRGPNEIDESPTSPLVPAIASKSRSGSDFEREAFEERAAIMEFDGGLTRADAEAAALAMLRATL